MPIPAASTDDYLRRAVADIIALLNTRQQHPTLAINPTTEQIVRQVAELLQRATPHPPTIALPAATNDVPKVGINPTNENPVLVSRVKTNANTVPVPRVATNENTVSIPRVRAPANVNQSKQKCSYTGSARSIGCGCI